MSNVLHLYNDTSFQPQLYHQGQLAHFIRLLQTYSLVSLKGNKCIFKKPKELVSSLAREWWMHLGRGGCDTGYTSSDLE